VTPSRPRRRGATNTVSSKTILVIAALVALALSASGCGGKSEADVTRCIEKKGLVVGHKRIRVRHISGGVKLDNNLNFVGGISPLHVKTSVAPALVVQTHTNRATIVFARTDDQADDAGFAPAWGDGTFPSEGTVSEDYPGHLVVIWDSQPHKDEGRLVEGCLS
jgi:hypothetical protein